MTETERICDELRRSFEGPAWHGPALLEALEGVDAGVAAARPLPGAHTIWELVLHLAAWVEVVRDRLGGTRARVPDEEDWPAVGETDAAAWERARTRLAGAYETLLQATADLDPARLDEALPGGQSACVTLHGVAQHAAYHGGQIILLKRAQGR